MPASLRPLVILLTEHESVWSSTARAEVLKAVSETEAALRECGYPVVQVQIAKPREIIYALPPFDPQNSVIFNWFEGLEAGACDAIHLLQLLERMGFNHTGADEYGWRIAQDKDNTKRHLVAQGIPTPRWLRVRDGKLADWNHFPAIIKATMEHGSEALTADNVVTNPRALQTRIAELCAAGMNDLIVSEYIAGRELSVAVWGDGMLQVLPPVEIDFSKLPFETPHVRSAASKWDEASQDYHAIRLICPSHLTPLQRERVERQAQVAFWACGLRDYGRIDMRMFGDELYVIDVNANPDITDGSSFILAAEAAGYEYPAMLDRIIQFASARQTRANTQAALWARLDDSV